MHKKLSIYYCLLLSMPKSKLCISCLKCKPSTPDLVSSLLNRKQIHPQQTHPPSGRSKVNNYVKFNIARLNISHFICNFTLNI